MPSSTRLLHSRFRTTFLGNCRNFSKSPRSANTNTGNGGEGSAISEALVTPLSQPLKNSPTPIYAKVGKETFETHTTRLSDGLTVTSQPKFGTYCTVGVLINAGSRFEVNYPSGVSHFLERMAFTGSSLYKTRDDVMQAMESFGGICDCQSSRDVTIYAASVSHDKLEPLVELLADTVFKPTLAYEDFLQAQQSIEFELEELHRKPDAEPMMTELIHEAAFFGNTVGLPRYSAPGKVGDIDLSVIDKYLRSYYTPSRMVIAGVGVDHEHFCKLSEKYMSNTAKSPSWSTDGPIERDLSIAQYTGGEIKVSKDFDLSLSVIPMPELAHVSIGLQSVKFTHDDFVPFAVLNMLMGGGGSFSAGGPGKGMFSRLYSNVLNIYHWMYAATAFHHSYEDGGVFCIQGSSHPTKLRDCVHVIIQEFTKLTQGTNPVELARAKKQLQSMLMMNLEARPVVFEDIGRQILSTGERKSPTELCEMIDRVTNDDIVRVAQRLLASRPAMAAMGNLRDLPSLEEVENALANPDRKPLQRSMFRFFS